jgi:hypothetical protein
VEPLTRGPPPPDPHSLSPLSSTEFVEPPLNKIPGYAAGMHNPTEPVLFTRKVKKLKRNSAVVKLMAKLYLKIQT